MTISYPLTLPTSLGMDRFAWTTFNGVGLLRSPFTFSTQAQEHQGQLWACDVGVAPTTDRAKAEAWSSFLISLRGPKGTFLLGDPRGKAPMGSAAGSPQVSSSGQTGNTLVTKGWTASAANVLKVGDFIQVGQRLYKVLNDVSASGSGTATLDIWPRLRESPAADSTIITSNTKGLFRLADSEVRVHEIDKELVYAISFSAVEAV